MQAPSFVLLGIGAIYFATGSTDMFAAQAALAATAPTIAKWILIALTAGFAVKMAVIPVHMWLPDAHGEAPAPMSALLSGVIISAGAYAILRLSLRNGFPSSRNNIRNRLLTCISHNRRTFRLLWLIHRVGCNRHKTAYRILKHRPHGLHNVRSLTVSRKRRRRNALYL